MSRSIALVAGLSLTLLAVHAPAQITPREAEHQLKRTVSEVLKQFKSDSKVNSSVLKSLLGSLQSSLRSDPNLAASLLSSAISSYADFVADQKAAADQGYGSVASELSSIFANLVGTATPHLMLGGCGLLDQFCERMDAELGKSIRKGIQLVKKFIEAATGTGNGIAGLTASFHANVQADRIAFDGSGTAVISSDQPIAAVSTLAEGSSTVETTFHGLGQPNLPQNATTYDSSGQTSSFQPTGNAKGVASFTVQQNSANGPIGSVVVYGNGSLAHTAPH